MAERANSCGGGSNSSPGGSVAGSENSPPAPPSPSQDKGLIPTISPTTPKRLQEPPSPPDYLQLGDPSRGTGQPWELQTLQPEAAMKLLARCVQSLVDLTGDVPPTPPVLVVKPAPPQGWNRENARISRVLDPTEVAAAAASGTLGADNSQPGSGATTPMYGRPKFHRRASSRPGTPVPSHDLHKPTFAKLTVGTPEAGADEPSVADTDELKAPVTPSPVPKPIEPKPVEQGYLERKPGSSSDLSQLAVQQQIIARKFFCKTPPPIPIEAYLKRMQHWCPMSTAVYLAAACYVCKLCVEDRCVPATTRTAHRLVLASLRVAMKALEDLRYPQDRFAIVGGVKQEELRALELSLCYLMDFELQVSTRIMERKVLALLQIARMTGPGKSGKENGGGLNLRLPVRAKAGASA